MHKLIFGENESIIKEMQGKQMSKTKRINKKLLCSLLCLALLALMFIPISAAPSKNNNEVIVGGCLFGLRMQTDGVPIVGIDRVETADGNKSPAYDAGIKLKDIIIKINGNPVTSVKQVTDYIEKSNGEEMNFTVKRNGAEKNITVRPLKGTDGKYHSGIWIRDSAAGIGTITYIDPKTNEFAGLGHGICDGDTASLLPLSRGTVTEVTLLGITKGQSGIPGEIKGSFKGGKKGALINNTLTGVYGIYASLPEGLGQKMTIGELDEIKTGEATVRCSVTGKIEDFKINITKISPKSDNGKNFSIEVTDPRLLEITGGIVQGMSGSPIIQNGKIIGAVTHVTINDPTLGYGIYIRNMMNH